MRWLLLGSLALGACAGAGSEPANGTLVECPNPVPAMCASPSQDPATADYYCMIGTSVAIEYPEPYPGLPACCVVVSPACTASDTNPGDCPIPDFSACKF